MVLSDRSTVLGTTIWKKLAGRGDWDSNKYKSHSNPKWWRNIDWNQSHWQQMPAPLLPVIKLESSECGGHCSHLKVENKAWRGRPLSWVQTRQLWCTAIPTTKFYYSSQTVKKHQAESDQICVKLSNKLKKKKKLKQPPDSSGGFRFRDSLKPELDFKTNTIPKTVRTRCLAGAVDNKAIPSGIICTPTLPGKWVIPNTHT